MHLPLFLLSPFFLCPFKSSQLWDVLYLIHWNLYCSYFQTTAAGFEDPGFLNYRPSSLFWFQPLNTNWKYWVKMIYHFLPFHLSYRIVSLSSLDRNFPFTHSKGYRPFVDFCRPLNNVIICLVGTCVFSNLAFFLFFFFFFFIF